MTTQNNEFEKQIEHIGELYESLQRVFDFVDNEQTTVQERYIWRKSLMELCDIACMAVKHIHQPKEN